MFRNSSSASEHSTEFALPSILSKHRLIVGFLLLVIALLIRMPNFNESLWYDEVWYTSVMLDSTSINQVLFHDVHPPLYPLIMKGWIELFGDSEISVRFPSLLFGLASLGVTFALAQAWFGRRIALLATLLMVLSPVHVWHCQETKNNMLLLLLTLLSVYGLQRALTNNSRRDWLLFIIAAILALWTNHFSLWVIFSSFLWLWLHVVKKQGPRPLKWTVISTVIVAAAYLPMLLSTLLQAEGMARDYLRPFSFSEIYKLFLIYLSHGNTLRTISPYAPIHTLTTQPWGFFLIDGLYAILICSGLFAVGRSAFVRHRQRQALGPAIPGYRSLLLAYFLIPPTLLLAASLIYPKIYIERCMIILLPPFMMLLAYALMTCPWPKWRRILIGCLLILNCFSLYNLNITKADTWTVYKPNPDWRGFANDFRSDMNGTIIFASCWPLAIHYYLKDVAFLATPMRIGPDADKLDVKVFIRREFKRRRIRNPIFFYVAINKHWNPFKLRELNDKIIGKMYPLVNKTHYFGLDVYKYSLYH